MVRGECAVAAAAIRRAARLCAGNTGAAPPGQHRHGAAIERRDRSPDVPRPGGGADASADGRAATRRGRRWCGFALPCRALRPRCRRADHERLVMARVSGEAGCDGDVPRPQGGPLGEPGHDTGARRICDSCQLRLGKRRQGDQAQRGDAGSFGDPGWRHQARRPGRRRENSGRPNLVRHIQGQPVRPRPEDAAGAVCWHRRRGGGGPGRRLSHCFKLLRRQCGVALRGETAQARSATLRV